MRKGRIAKKERSERAQLRKEARGGRTNQQQLDVLDEKLGAGVGATRERKRLLQVTKDPVGSKSAKVATTKSQRRKEKAERHARRSEDGS